MQWTSSCQHLSRLEQGCEAVWYQLCWYWKWRSNEFIYYFDVYKCQNTHLSPDCEDPAQPTWFIPRSSCNIWLWKSKIICDKSSEGQTDSTSNVCGHSDAWLRPSVQVEERPRPVMWSIYYWRPGKVRIFSYRSWLFQLICEPLCVQPLSHVIESFPCTLSSAGPCWHQRRVGYRC